MFRFISIVSWFVFGFLLFGLTAPETIPAGRCALSAVEVMQLVPSEKFIHPLITLIGRMINSEYGLNLFTAGISAAMLAFLYFFTSSWCRYLFYRQERYEQMWLAELGGHLACLVACGSLSFVFGGSIFNIPTWSTFLIGVFLLGYWFYCKTKSLKLVVLLGFLQGAALLESEYMWIFLPVALCLTIFISSSDDYLYPGRRIQLWGGGVILGVAVTFYSMMFFNNEIALLDINKNFIFLMKTYLNLVKQVLPQQWIFYLGTGFVLPAVCIVAGTNMIVNDRKRTIASIVCGSILLMGVAGVLTVSRFSLWTYAVANADFPMTVTLFFALGSGILCVGWMTFFYRVLKQENATDIYSTDEENDGNSRILQTLSCAAAFLSVPILFLVLSFAIFQTWQRRMDTDCTLAAKYSEKILEDAEGKALILGTSWIDPTLRLAIHRSEKKMRVLSSYLHRNPKYIESLSQYIQTSPVFGHDRIRAENLLKLNFLIFMQDFFLTDYNAEKYAVSFTMPEVWKSRKLRSIPNPTFYAGYLQNGELPSDEELLQKHNEFWEKWEEILLKPNFPQWDLNRGFCINVKRHTSHLANDLGCYFLDNHNQKYAIKAIMNSYKFCDENIAALMNLQEIVLKTNEAPDLIPFVQNAMTRFFDIWRKRQLPFDILRIQTVYGQIRNAELFHKMGMQWMTRLAPNVLLSELRNSKESPKLSNKERSVISAMLATTYEAILEYELAEIGYREILEYDPADDFIIRSLCRILIAKSDYEGLKELLLNANKAGVKDELLDLEWAQYSLFKGELTKAIEYINRYTANNPKDPDSLLMLGTISLAMGKKTFVKHTILPKLKAVATRENSHLVSLLLGHIAYLEKTPESYKESRAAYRDVYRKNKDKIGAIKTILSLDILLHDAENAELDALTILSLEPSNKLANHVIGSMRLEASEPEIAIKYFEKTLAESSDNPFFLNNYASALLFLKRPEEALKIMEKIFETNKHQKLSPDQRLTIVYTQVSILAALKKTTEARQLLKTLSAEQIEKSPHTPLLLAQIYHAENNKTAALNEVQKFKELRNQKITPLELSSCNEIINAFK